MRLLAGLLLCAHSVAQTHATPMAGPWFPASRTGLLETLDRSYAAARLRGTPPRPGLLALVVPHAGMDYSGAVAAAAWRLLPAAPGNIILLAFSHRTPYNEVLAPNLDAYTTPLGETKVNRSVLDQLGFRRVDEKTLCDHSLENQLPFLRRAAPNATITPLYVGDLDAASLAAAARKLSLRLQQGDLIVASSDFTHFGAAYRYTPYPNDAKLRSRLRDLANQAFEAIGSLHPATFDRHLVTTRDTICGANPIRLLMATLAAHRNDVYMSTIDYRTSSDVTGDWSTSVGYAALAFYPASSFRVDPTSQRRLIAHSRATLESMLDRAPAPVFGIATPALLQHSGAFVTIRKKSDLRGCVGTLSPTSVLPDTIADRTLAAARSDPRFPPLSRAEGPVSIELSLLTPLKLIPDWRVFRLGQGGVILLGSSGGLLLPQVAREMGWNREQFLEGLSRKAGLDSTAYRRARLYVFQAQVFGE